MQSGDSESGKGCASSDRKRRPKSARAKRRWEKAFLGALSEVGVVTIACEAAEVHRSVVYRVYDADATFREKGDDALEESTERLEAEVVRRARG